MVENNSREKLSSSSKTEAQMNGVLDEMSGVDEKQGSRRLLKREVFGFIQASVLERKSKSNSKYSYLKFERISNGNSWDGCYASDLINHAQATLWAAEWFLGNGDLKPNLELKLNILVDVLSGVDNIMPAYEENLRTFFKQAMDERKNLTQS